jgi:hypothetical protein
LKTISGSAGYYSWKVLPEDPQGGGENRKILHQHCTRYEIFTTVHFFQKRSSWRSPGWRGKSKDFTSTLYKVRNLHHCTLFPKKFVLKIPRVAGKIERFYINIVQGTKFTPLYTFSEKVRPEDPPGGGENRKILHQHYTRYEIYTNVHFFRKSSSWRSPGWRENLKILHQHCTRYEIYTNVHFFRKSSSWRSPGWRGKSKDFTSTLYKVRNLHHCTLFPKKFVLKIPGVAGKIERFYMNIVQGTKFTPLYTFSEKVRPEDQRL